MKKAIQKLQKVYPKLTVRGIFHCPFLLSNLFTLRQGGVLFVMSVCDVELSVYKKIFEREQRPIYGTG